MKRSPDLFLNTLKSVVEFTINSVLVALNPPQQRPVPVVAMANREWARAAAARRQLTRD